MAVAHLYVAHSGRFFSAWWETMPPEPTVKDPHPVFRPPDIYHENVVGTLESILRDFVEAKIIQLRFQRIVISNTWAAIGVRRAGKARSKARPKKISDPCQESLFADTTTPPKRTP